MARGSDDEPVEDGDGSVFAIPGVCDGSEEGRYHCDGSQTKDSCQCDIPGNSIDEVGGRMKDVAA